MRYLVASMVMCFCTAGFCQEETPSAPAEVTISDEGGSSEEVAVSDSLRDVRDFDCGCPQKDRKPKL